MTRKTITVTEAVYDRLAELKNDDESWTEFCDRIATAFEAQDGDVNTDANSAEPLTEEHIDDIAAEVERRVGRDLENRLMGH